MSDRRLESSVKRGSDGSLDCDFLSWRKYRKSSCGSRHCCGSEEIQIGLWRERSLLRQWGNVEKAPAGADTAAAVGKYSYGSCGSTHCCGSGEIRLLLERELLGWLMWR